MLSGFADGIDENNLDRLRQGLSQLARNTRELQESVMQIRMLPISFAFNRFPRIVHDLSRKLAKKVELKLSGEGTELDKTVLEKISDPLVHLVRNALDHGLEIPERRGPAATQGTTPPTPPPLCQGRPHTNHRPIHCAAAQNATISPRGR